MRWAMNSMSEVFAPGNFRPQNNADGSEDLRGYSKILAIIPNTR